MYRLESIGKFALGILLGFTFSIGSIFLLISWIVDSLQSWQFTFLLIVTLLIILGVVQFLGRKGKYSFQYWEGYAQVFLLGGILGVLSFPQEFTNYRPLTILMVVLFSGVLFVQKELRRIRRKSYKKEKKTNKKDDLLNSKKYADEVYQHIERKLKYNDKNVSILINGEWGVGKTFMIENLLIPELKSDDHIEHVHFQSQKVYFHQEYALINLLKQMQESILEESNLGYSAKYKIYRAFQTWVNALSPRVKFSFLEFSPAIENVKIDKAVEEINKAFEKEGRFLVVIIDDVDRLPIDVAKEFFDLVSYLQNFSRMIPIIVFDKENLGRIYDTDEYSVEKNNKFDNVETLKKAIPSRSEVVSHNEPGSEIINNLRSTDVKKVRYKKYSNFSKYILKSTTHQVNINVCNVNEALDYIESSKISEEINENTVKGIKKAVSYICSTYPNIYIQYLSQPRNINFILENLINFESFLKRRDKGVVIESGMLDLEIKDLLIVFMIYMHYPKIFNYIYVERNNLLPNFEEGSKEDTKYLLPSKNYSYLLAELDERCALLTDYLFLNVFERVEIGSSYGKIDLVSTNMLRYGQSSKLLQNDKSKDYRLNKQSWQLSSDNEYGNFDLVLEYIRNKEYLKKIYMSKNYHQNQLNKYLNGENLYSIIQNEYLNKFREDEKGKAELPASEFILHIGSSEKQVLEKKSLEDVVKDLIQCFPLGTVVSYEDSNQFAEVEVDMYTTIGKLIRYEVINYRQNKSELNSVIDKVVEAIKEQNINPLMQLIKLGQLWYWTKIEESKDGFTSIVEIAYNIFKKEFIDREINIFEEVKELSDQDLFEIYNSDDILPQSERDRIVELYRNGKTFRYIWYESSLSGKEQDAFKNYLKICFKTDSNAFERYFLMFSRYNHHSMDSNTKLIFNYDNQTLSPREIQQIFEDIKRRREDNPIPNFYVPYLEHEYTEIKDEFYNAITSWLDRNLPSGTNEE